MKKILFIGVLTLLAGCSVMNTRAIVPSSLSMLNNKSMMLIIHDSPDFMAMTFGKSMFNYGDVDEAYQKGKRLVADNGIVDPAGEICRVMAESFGSRYGVKYNENAMIKIKSNGSGDVVRLANGKDYILELETVDWSFIYNDYTRAEYKVEYGVRMRLVDADKSRTIMSRKCDYNSKKAGKPLVSYATLVADNAAYIKQTLDDAATFCAGEFEKELSAVNH